MSGRATATRPASRSRPRWARSRADALIASTAPANLDEAPAAPLGRADVAVSLSYVELPPRPAAKGASWTQPATAELLPDRLVLLGWAGGKLVLEQLGASLPPRVQVGPDPSGAPGDQLHGVDGELAVRTTLRWLVDFDRAVADGLGFRVPLDDATRGGLDRLRRARAARSPPMPAATAAGLETLLAHHLHAAAGSRSCRRGRRRTTRAARRSGVQPRRRRGRDLPGPVRGAAAFDRRGDWLARP